jgi:thiamine pyrophosphate-dependent acetolactate synthase large subunit-like protein
MSPPIAWSGPEELETVQRHGIKLLICIINDGGYGAEMHKFRAYGVDPMHAPHRRGGIAQVARGFGLNGTKVTSLGQFEDCSVRTRRSTVPPCGTCMLTVDSIAQLPPGPLRRSLIV